MIDEQFLSLAKQFIQRIVEMIGIGFLLESFSRRRLLHLPIALYVALFAFGHTLLYQLLGDPYPYFTYVYYPLIFAFIMLMYRMSLRLGIYYTVLFFLSVHSLRLSMDIVYRLLYGQVSQLSAEGIYSNLLILVLYTVLLLSILTYVKRFTSQYPQPSLSWKQLAGMAVAMIPVLYMGNLGLWTHGIVQDDLPLSVSLIGMVSSICGLVIIVGYNNTLALAQKKQELLRLETMLINQRRQFELKKKMADMINQKYHDLKNHLMYLSTTRSQEERAAYIKSLESEIGAYGTLQQTGNEALDIVLTSKSLECRRQGIRLLPFLDGKMLSFLKPLDIDTIFGNAIDNAVCALEKVEEEKRDFSIRMSVHKTWLVLCFENPFAGNLLWEEGVLHSTKPDGESHGIGLKSIECVVQKYEGNVTVEAKDQQFRLFILFPLHSPPSSLRNRN